MSDSIKANTVRARKFCDEREWAQFHNPKDTAISLSLEAAEVLEHFQWKSPEEIKDYLAHHRGDIADELADVFYWVLLMCDYLQIDLSTAFEAKMRKNELKYPVEKARGRHTKYDKL